MSAQPHATQCERVLAVLRDGDWHDIGEIHRRAGTMRLNSRISELRGRGYTIDCKPNGAKTRYQLTGSPSDLQGDTAEAVGVAASAEQLTLDDAARGARPNRPDWA